MHPLYPYLHRIQYPHSGLMESFAQSRQEYLHQVAFTYDLALAAIVFTHHGSLEEAARILEFFRSMPLPTSNGLNFRTAYHVWRRTPVLEEALQIGPIAWAALALIRYTECTQQRLYLYKAISLLDWIRSHVAHAQGGLVMGIDGPWTSRMSAENNWAYYAALRAAVRLMPDGPQRWAFEEEERCVRQWLARYPGNRGHNDPVKALDVYTSALLVGPASHLEHVFMGDPRALAQWVKPWIQEMIALFRVQGTAAFDYAESSEARRANRARVGWLEGTEQASLALRVWAPWFRVMGDVTFANEIESLGIAAHNYVTNHCLTINGAVAIPNTDSREPVLTFADGWLARPVQEPALNGTTWAYLSDVGYNPYTASLHP